MRALIRVEAHHSLFFLEGTVPEKCPVASLSPLLQSSKMVKLTVSLLSLGILTGWEETLATREVSLSSPLCPPVNGQVKQYTGLLPNLPSHIPTSCLGETPEVSQVGQVPGFTLSTLNPDIAMHVWNLVPHCAPQAPHLVSRPEHELRE